MKVAAKQISTIPSLYVHVRRNEERVSSDEGPYIVDSNGRSIPSRFEFGRPHIRFDDNGDDAHTGVFDNERTNSTINSTCYIASMAGWLCLYIEHIQHIIRKIDLKAKPKWDHRMNTRIANQILSVINQTGQNISHGHTMYVSL